MEHGNSEHHASGGDHGAYPYNEMRAAGTEDRIRDSPQTKGQVETAGDQEVIREVEGEPGEKSATEAGCGKQEITDSSPRRV